MPKSFVFDPAVSDLVTFARLRTAKYFEKGEKAWAGWVDGTDACGYDSLAKETDPTKILTKDGYLPCDSVEEAQTEVAAKIAATVALGFKPVELTTSGEPAAFLARITQSPTEALAIAVELSARYFESKRNFRLLWPEGRAVYQREGKLGTFDHTTFEPEEDGGHLGASSQEDRVTLVKKVVDRWLAEGFVEKPLPAFARPAPTVAKHVAAWAALAGAKDSAKAFTTHFAFLAESAECKALLKEVAARVRTIAAKNGELIITFATGKDEWCCVPKRPG